MTDRKRTDTLAAALVEIHGTPLNPGIQQTVGLLNENGFLTCDSGDGQTRDHECDRDDPYVVIQLDDPASLVDEASRLVVLLRSLGVELGPVGIGPVWIQANYDPWDCTAFIDVTGIHDDLLPDA